MKSFSLYTSGRLLWAMSKNELKSRYVGNFGGILWAFVQPSISIAIFWFVFSVGFKAAPVNNVEFILWLMAGMIPWFFFAEAVSGATNAVLESSFLIKKIVFEAGLLPVVKVVAALSVHLFFVLVLVGVYLLYGYGPSLYWLQLVYYVVCGFVLALGIGLLTSSIAVFFRDVSQMVGMGIQFGFWLTPIFWNIEMVGERYRSVLELNPVYYVVEGYRESMVSESWFWEKPVESLMFWCMTLFIFMAGAFVFRKLKPHFADVM